MTGERRIAGSTLEALSAACLEAAGAWREEAAAVASALALADLKGHVSHGVALTPLYVRFTAEGLMRPGAELSTVADRGVVAVFDGQRGYGQVQAPRALDRGCETAEREGAAIVALRNVSHLGRIGQWGEYCAARGVASIHIANVVDHAPLVAPFGGADARLSTNPFCAALPGACEPERHGAATVFDIATSTIAMGKAKAARAAGAPAPEGALIDGEGRPTTDPAPLVDHWIGALTAFGAHKGSGLAMIAELFAGALIGGATLAPHHPRAGGIVNNMLSVLIDPAAFGDREAFEREAEAARRFVAASPVAEGFDRLRLPGDVELERYRDRIANGVPMAVATIEDLAACARRLGVDPSALEG